MKKFYVIVVMLFIGIQQSLVAQTSETDPETITPESVFRTKITKKQIQSSTKIGLMSLLSTQTGFFQQKNNITFHNRDFGFLKIDFDGMDIKDPFTGELAFTPILESLDNISIGDEFNSDNISLSTEVNRLHLKSSVGYMLDGFKPSATSRGYQSVFGFVNGPVPEFNSVNISFAAKRTFNQSLWVNGEPIAEFYDGANIADVPVNRIVRVGANNERDSIVSSNLDYYAPDYRKGEERTQYDIYGKISYENNDFSVAYQTLLMVADGRSGVGILGALVDKNRPAFEQLNQLHRLTIKQNLSENLNYSVSADLFSADFSGYDPTFKDNVMEYGDPDKNPMYVYSNNRIYLKSGQNTALSFVFHDDLSYLSSYTKIKQNYLQFSGNVNYSGIENLKASVGFKNRSHEIRYLNFNPVTLKARYNSFFEQNNQPEDVNKYLARSINANNYGFDILGNESDSKTDSPRKPFELNVYSNAEFTIPEIGTVFGGINYQRLNLGAIGLHTSVHEGALGYLTDDSFFETEIENNLGFNLGIKSREVSGITFWMRAKKENIIPGYSEYYAGIASLSRSVLSGGNAFNQPVSADPKSIETKLIDMGVHYNFENKFEFKGSFLINTLKNMPQFRTFTLLKDGVPSQMYALIPDDEMQSSEIELQAETARWNYVKVFAGFNKTIDKTGSILWSPQFRTVWENPGSSYNNIVNTSQDEYQFNTSIDFHANQENEISDVINEFGITVYYQRHSGYPYTRTSSYLYTPIEEINASVTPANYQIDLSADVGFSFSSLKGLVFVKIENLTNHQNIYHVFSQTGSPYDDGHLATQEAQDIKNSNETNKKFYEPLYNAFTNQNNPAFFGSPRTVTVGAVFNF